MPKLIALRGYSGSGKSTWAREWLDEDPNNRLVTSRDDLRHTLFNEEGVLTNDKEALITKIQQQVIADALENDFDVVVDNTSLRTSYLKDFADLASDLGADFEVVDFKVDINTCIRRDNIRQLMGQRYVGPKVIQEQARRFPIQNWKPVTARPKANINIEPYVIEDGLPYVVVVDIDGTVADHDGLRGHFDWGKVGGDLPKGEIIKIVGLLSRTYDVIFFSGREDVCRDDTIKWLRENITLRKGIELYMRKAGDSRPDWIVKYELFQKYIRGKYNVAAVIDDRLQVVRMWHKLGVPVFRVGDPDAAF